jgi:hypothetical protein
MSGETLNFNATVECVNKWRGTAGIMLGGEHMSARLGKNVVPSAGDSVKVMATPAPGYMRDPYLTIIGINACGCEAGPRGVN